MMFDPRAVARARRRATRGPNVASAVRPEAHIRDQELRPTPPPEQQTAAPVGGHAASSASRSPHQNGLKSEAPMPRVRKHGIGDCITS